MTYDDRERRDWPGEDAEASSSMPEPISETEPRPDETEPIETPPTPVREDADDSSTADDSAPAEIESWPSQDATAAHGPASSETSWPTEPPAAGSTAADAWPTEPPAAGSTAADAWPTEPPERGGEPILEPEWRAPERAEPERAEPEPIAPERAEPEPIAPEPPPSELEAYPAASPGDAVASAAAASTAAAAAHSVPAAESTTGESTQCPRCGTENRPGLAFCRNCGQRLVAAGVATTIERPGTPEGTQACPRCGTHNRAGVAFCQNCGANLRGTAPGYVPPAMTPEGATVIVEPARRGAVLGPVVLLVGLVGLVTAYLLPYAYGPGSLFERAFGANGYGVAFWNGYPDVGANVADQAYFGLAGPVPLLGLLLLALAIAGFVRAAPGPLQAIGLGVALLWSVGLVVLFVLVELAANWSGDLVGLLRVLTPAGIIFFLAGLIVLIGTLTRFARS